MKKSFSQKIDLLKHTNKQRLQELLEQCREEAHRYFDEHIYSLPKDEFGNFIYNKKTRKNFYDNDVDAFRHAYTSGIFTHEYFSLFADVLGLANELFGNNPVEAQNMDLWNNAVGRKYGKKMQSKQELGDFIKKALERGELIIDPNDPREYKGLRHFNYDPEKPVRVIKESETGRNDYFLDCSTGDIMDRDMFVAAIESGHYPGYTIAMIDGLETPMSKPDGVTCNNLG